MAPLLLRFGPFEADPGSRELRRGGRRVRLPDQPFRVLLMLLERPGQVVTREEIQQRLWRDSFVDVEHGLNTAVRHVRRALGDSASAPRFVETLPRRGYRFLAAVEGARPLAPPRPAVAVLPFADVSPEAQPRFADGVTDQIIANLAQLSGLRVTSRTSAMRFRDSPLPLPEIARALDVQSIVEGTVLVAGGAARVTVKLVHAASDDALWAEEYRRPLADVFALQAEVARAVATHVHARLTADECARLAAGGAVQPGVHAAYLEARFAAFELTPAALDRAIALYRQILAAEPGFAPAWAGLADALCWHPPVVAADAPRSFAAARAAATRALELDPASAQARKALAWVRHAADWDTAAADAEFARALALAPGDPLTHAWYAIFVAQLGRFAAAAEHMEEALRLDPLSAHVRSLAEIPPLVAGDAAAFLARVRRTRELDPASARTLQHLVRHYEESGDLAAAIDSRERLQALDATPAAAAAHHATWRSDLAQLGAAGYWRRVLAELAERGRASGPEPFQAARALAALGDVEGSFAALERACAERSALLRFRLRSARAFRSLHDDPRFAGLLARAGFAGEPPLVAP